MCSLLYSIYECCELLWGDPDYKKQLRNQEDKQTNKQIKGHEEMHHVFKAVQMKNYYCS